MFSLLFHFSIAITDLYLFGLLSEKNWNNQVYSAWTVLSVKTKKYSCQKITANFFDNPYRNTIFWRTEIKSINSSVAVDYDNGTKS